MSDLNGIEERDISFFRETLWDWIDQNGLRDFPWRESTSEFEILVSEILLRRTKATKVAELWTEFFSKYRSFDDILRYREDLSSDIEELGLASVRSNSLINMAEQIEDQIPKSEEKLLSLPGVGLYSARMLPLMIENEKKSIFDSNFRRIYNRFFDLEIIKDLKRDPVIDPLSDKIIPENNPRDFVLGILDFGAIVCKPRSPICDQCDLSTRCSFFQNTTSSQE